MARRSAAELFHLRIVLPCGVQVQAQLRGNVGNVRREHLDLAHRGNGLERPAGLVQQAGITRIGGPVARVERQRSPVAAFCGCEVTIPIARMR
jgi:hypothetical protein